MTLTGLISTLPDDSAALDTIRSLRRRVAQLEQNQRVHLALLAYADARYVTPARDGDWRTVARREQRERLPDVPTTAPRRVQP